MSEALQQPENLLSHQVIMDFYSAIKNIEGLYGYSFAIQDIIDEKQKKFTCTIVISGSLPLEMRAEIKEQILSIIQEKILIALPGYQSSGEDIVLKDDDDRNIKRTMDKANQAFAGADIPLSSRSGCLGLLVQFFAR